MIRSLKKGPFVANHLLKKIESLNIYKKLVVTWSRAYTIVPTMIGHTIVVHNGQNIYLLILQSVW